LNKLITNFKIINAIIHIGVRGDGDFIINLLLYTKQNINISVNLNFLACFCDIFKLKQFQLRIVINKHTYQHSLTQIQRMNKKY